MVPRSVTGVPVAAPLQLKNRTPPKGAYNVSTRISFTVQKVR